MTENITCRSMKSLEMNDDVVALEDYGNDTRSSVYIPQNRFMKRNKNVLYITGGSVMLLLLVTILLVISFKKSPTCISVIEHKIVQSNQTLNNGASSSATSINTTPQYFTTTIKSTSYAVKPIPLSRALIMKSGRNLWAVDPSSLSNQLLRQMKRNIVAYDVNLNETLLWIERNTSVVSRLNDSFGISYSGKWEPQAIAADHITDKLYVIDKQAGTLNVIDLQHNHTGIVLSDLTDPYDIVLDSSAGLMFIVELDYSILRYEMDGTSLTGIAKNKKISAIAINRKVKKIYWVTEYKTIETSDYDGIHHLIFHADHTGYVSSLVFHDDQIFWLSTTVTSDKTIVYSCKTNGIHCDDLLERSVPFSTQTIRAAPEPMDATRKNPCATNNGDCEQLCLLNTNGYSCACKIGFQLNRNMKTCNSITKFLLYPDGRYFRGRILNSLKRIFIDVFSPTRFFTLSLEIKKTIDFDRGWDFYEVYFSDDLGIYRLNLTDGNQKKIYQISDFKNYHIDSLLIDRSSDNFYFSKISNHNGDRSVVIVTIKGGHALEKTFTSLGQDGPFFMALHPEYLFYIYKNPEGVTITYENEETHESWIVEYSPVYILSIDNSNNILYWIQGHNIYYVTISYSDMQNRVFNYFEIELPTDIVITTLYVYQQWLYVGDGMNIWRFDKNTGSNKILVISTHKPDLKISGAQVSDLYLLEGNKSSACAIQNGGCEQFCFTRKQRICSCRDGMMVLDGTDCE